MSSLMQFDGLVGRRGVRLEFSKGVLPWEEAGHRFVYREPVPCPTCGKDHAQLYVAWRKPCGMFGPWVQFRFNGEVHAPDLSIPIDVWKIPRDARPLSPEDNAAAWHRS